MARVRHDPEFARAVYLVYAVAAGRALTMQAYHNWLWRYVAPLAKAAGVEVEGLGGGSR